MSFTKTKSTEETRAGVIGAGSWGIALAHVLSKNGHGVRIYSRTAEQAALLNAAHENREKLPGVVLPDTVRFTSSLAEAVSERELLILAVPSAQLRATAAQLRKALSARAEERPPVLVNCSKGIEAGTLVTMSAVLEEELPECPVAVLSGPSHAEEVGRDLPTTIVVGARDRALAQYVQNIFMNEAFRVYTSPDMRGIEIGGALKNVIALAAGIADGLGCGDNTKAALITRGLAEIVRLGAAMGGRAETFYGLSGIGDLIVTCASMHSRNRRAGILIGKGYSAEEAMREVRMVVEGVYSAQAAFALAEKYDVSMPIVEQVNQVLFHEKPPADAVRELMLRDRKTENGDAYLFS